MTKEEVAQVIAYCDENNISYKLRLAELGINPWNIYDAKSGRNICFFIILCNFALCYFT